METLFLIILLTSITTEAGKYVQCYICESGTDSLCDVKKMCKGSVFAEPLPSLTWNPRQSVLIEPGTRYTPEYACVKYITESGGNRTTTRSCTLAKIDSFDTCPNLTAYFDKRKKLEYCDVCDENYCNKSSSYFISTLLNVGLPLASRYWL